AGTATRSTRTQPRSSICRVVEAYAPPPRSCCRTRNAGSAACLQGFEAGVVALSGTDHERACPWDLLAAHRARMLRMSRRRRPRLLLVVLDSLGIQSASCVSVATAEGPPERALLAVVGRFWDDGRR